MDGASHSLAYGRDVSEIPRVRQLSLWDRRKLEAMRDIQDVALQLFESHGYRSVSVERVAAEVGVSPSTVYRYFGTKEMLVVWNDYDWQIIDLLRTDGHQTNREQTVTDLVREFRSAANMLVGPVLDSSEERIKRRMRLIASEPDVRAGQVRTVQEIEAEVRGALATRLGLDAGDLEIRLAAAQAAWSVLAAMDYWVAGDFAEPLQQILNTAVDASLKAVEVVLRRVERTPRAG